MNPDDLNVFFHIPHTPEEAREFRVRSFFNNAHLRSLIAQATKASKAQSKSSHERARTSTQVIVNLVSPSR